MHLHETLCRVFVHSEIVRANVSNTQGQEKKKKKIYMVLIECALHVLNSHMVFALISTKTILKISVKQYEMTILDKFMLKLFLAYMAFTADEVNGIRKEKNCK